MKHNMLRNHVLSDYDRKFLIETAKSSEPSDMYIAINVLMKALSNGFFAKSTLLKLIEWQLFRVSPEVSVPILGMYRIEIYGKLIRFDRKNLAEATQLYKSNSDPGKFNAREKLFVKNILVNPDGQQRLLAGQVLVCKENLIQATF